MLEMFEIITRTTNRSINVSNVKKKKKPTFFDLNNSDFFERVYMFYYHFANDWTLF